MKLIDLLDATEQFDGDLVTKDFESKYGFCWDDTAILTDEGKQKFKQLLESEIKINGAIIILQDNNILQEDYDFFMSTVAGYESAKDYDEWFKNKEEKPTRTAMNDG